MARKFTIFALFYFVFEGKFQVQALRGGLIFGGRFNGGFFALRFWGASIWRGLFSEFYGIAPFYLACLVYITPDNFPADKKDCPCFPQTVVLEFYEYQ